MSRTFLAGVLLFSGLRATAAPYATSAPIMTAPPASTTHLVPMQASPIVQVVQTEGTVMSVDAFFGKLTVRDDASNTLELQTISNSPILQKGVQINVGDLHPGDRVLVRYNPQSLLAQFVQKQ